MRKPCYVCNDATSHVLGCPVADLPETHWAVCVIPMPAAVAPIALPEEYWRRSGKLDPETGSMVFMTTNAPSYWVTHYVDDITGVY